MTKGELIKNFRITIKIEQFLGIDQTPQHIFEFSKYARGIKKLRSAYAECFNEADKFIRIDLEEEQK